MIPKPIAEILSDIVTKMRDSGNIISIISQGNNIYRIIVDKLRLTFIDDYISILTMSIDNDFKVVETGDNYFDIFSATLLVNEIGTFSNQMPIYDYDKFDKEARYLSEKNFTEEKFKKFPLVFFLFDYAESRTIEYRTTNLKLFFIEKTKAEISLKTRNTTTLFKLRQIFDRFLYELKANKHTNFVDEFSYTELPYNENQLNAIVDAIEIEFSNIKFINCNQ